MGSGWDGSRSRTCVWRCLGVCWVQTGLERLGLEASWKGFLIRLAGLAGLAGIASLPGLSGIVGAEVGQVLVGIEVAWMAWLTWLAG